MSHFSLIVALPGDIYDVEKELADRLAPYDENEEVTPYKNYEESSPENFWWYTSFKTSAEEVANGDRSSVKPYKPDEFGISSAWSKDTEAEQWEKIKQEAHVFNALPNPVTWEALTAAYNRYYCEGFPYSDGSRLEYDPETGGAFEWSTYNPESKWDWYSIGGRWSDYFPISTHSPQLITGRRAYGLDETSRVDVCDGGPKWALDLEQLRIEKGNEAGEDYDRYHEAFGHLPTPKPWSTFLSLVDDGTIDSIDTARELYGSQARVAATRGHPEFRTRWSVDHGKYARPREVVVQEAEGHAVPGYALLTLDKVWVAPGSMGWFGMSSENDGERDAYKAQANEYIDNLPDDTILVVVDLHI